MAHQVYVHERGVKLNAVQAIPTPPFEITPFLPKYPRYLAAKCCITTSLLSQYLHILLARPAKSWLLCDLFPVTRQAQADCAKR